MHAPNLRPTAFDAIDAMDSQSPVAEWPDRRSVWLALGAIVVAIVLLTLFVDLLHTAIAQGRRLHAEQRASNGAWSVKAVDLLDESRVARRNLNMADASTLRAR